MPLSTQEVDKIAKLARLELTEEEKNKYAEQLSAILEYVEQLKNADITNTEPFFQSGSANVLRQDEIKPFTETKQLIDSAPQQEGNFIKVRSIL